MCRAQICAHTTSTWWARSSQTSPCSAMNPSSSPGRFASHLPLSHPSCTWWHHHAVTMHTPPPWSPSLSDAPIDPACQRESPLTPEHFRALPEPRLPLPVAVTTTSTRRMDAISGMVVDADAEEPVRVPDAADLALSPDSARSLTSSPGTRQTPREARPRPVTAVEDDEDPHSGDECAQSTTVLDHRILY